MATGLKGVGEGEKEGVGVGLLGVVKAFIMK